MAGIPRPGRTGSPRTRVGPLNGARPLDTSTLGPIRIEPQRVDRARELFAAEVERQGPAWRNAADSVRSGYSNAWIEAGLAAIGRLLRQLPEDDHGRE